jgi:hypothetical protein
MHSALPGVRKIFVICASEATCWSSPGSIGRAAMCRSSSTLVEMLPGQQRAFHHSIS